VTYVDISKEDLKEIINETIKEILSNESNNYKLLTKADLAKRWQVAERTIDEYREKGIIKKVSKISSIRFNPQHIADIEETKSDKLSQMERKKLEGDIEFLKQKLAAYEEIRAMLLNVLSKIINL